MEIIKEKKENEAFPHIFGKINEEITLQDLWNSKPEKKCFEDQMAKMFIIARLLVFLDINCSFR